MNERRDIGALAALDSASVLEALSLARTGRVYDLGVDLGNETPRLRPDQLPGFVMSPFRTPRSFADQPMAGMSFSNEVVFGGLHQTCHLDALIHAQRHGRVYGGGTVEELHHDAGWKKHGAETIPPIVARGVLIDVAGLLGHAPLPDRFIVTPEHLAAAVERQQVELRPGDAVLVRTGKILQFATDRAAFERGNPGLSAAGAAWLAERGMVFFGLDATSADAEPVADWNATAHEELLIRRGIHILENAYLEDLARDGIRQFAFVCLPLRIQGATGSWVRPIAIA